MVEIEELIGYIKGKRRKGFRDDFIWRRLSNDGYSIIDINRAFSLSGRRIQFDLRHRIKKGEDVSKTTIYMVVDETLKKALKKKADMHNMTLFNDLKKLIVEYADLHELDRKEYLRLFARHKLTREAKNRHKLSARNYSQRVLIEMENMAKRRGWFGLGK